MGMACFLKQQISSRLHLGPFEREFPFEFKAISLKSEWLNKFLLCPSPPIMVPAVFQLHSVGLLYSAYGGGLSTLLRGGFMIAITAEWAYA
jgi:hypothetical protein